MNHGLHPDVAAATRLTRAGRLSEATALLQRVLGSGPVPHPASGQTGDTAHAPPGRGSPIIDLTPDTIELTDAEASPPARQDSGTTGASQRPTSGAPGTARSHLPEALRSFLDRVGRRPSEPGTGELPGRSLPPAPDVVPHGGRFLAGAPMAIRPEGALTSSTSRAATVGRQSPWSSCCTAALSRPTTSPPARG